MEFLIVMAVMGIFGGLALSIGKRVMNKVHSVADQMRLTYLVADYLSAFDSGQLDLTNVRNMVDFAVALAKAGGSNEISAYQSQKRRNKQHKEILINGEKNPSLKKEDFDFILVVPHQGSPIPGIISSYGTSDRTTPICYSRGLQPNGRWSKDSLYGSKGGLIAFMDSHVEWHESVNDDLLDYLF